MNYREALNIEDLHRIARRRLPRIAYECLADGVPALPRGATA